MATWLSDANLQNLAHATTAWLSYSDLCGMKGILNESSINVPIGTFIASNSDATLRSEVTHPGFGAKRGRPRQLDFALYNNQGKVTQVYELKWADANTQAIIDDVYRLESIGIVNIGGDDAFDNAIGRFFIVAGPDADVKALKKRGVNVGGGKEKLSDFILCFDPAANAEEKRIKLNVETCDAKVRDLIRHYQDFYFTKPRERQVPKIVHTKLIAHSATGGYQVFVWKVNRAQGTLPVRITKTGIKPI